MADVLMLGSTGLVGSLLLQRLSEAGHNVTAVSRRAEPGVELPGVTWHQADVTTPDGIDSLPTRPVLVSSVQIEVTAGVAEHMIDRGLSRVVAFSSTSALTKTDASSPAERALAAKLMGGERRLAALAPTLESTILRPTMIYGRRGDRNVERIADQVSRLPVFPLIGGGRGLRQPVHAADLADAAVQALDAPAAAGQTYNLSGGEILSVRDLVSRVGEVHGKRVRFVNMPLPVAKAGLRAAGVVIPRFRNVPAGALERMTKDLVFDHTAASTDFGYAPRAFTPPIYS